MQRERFSAPRFFNSSQKPESVSTFTIPEFFLSAEICHSPFLTVSVYYIAVRPYVPNPRAKSILPVKQTQKYSLIAVSLNNGQQYKNHSYSSVLIFSNSGTGLIDPGTIFIYIFKPLSSVSTKNRFFVIKKHNLFLNFTVPVFSIKLIRIAATHRRLQSFSTDLLKERNVLVYIV